MPFFVQSLLTSRQYLGMCSIMKRLLLFLAFVFVAAQGCTQDYDRYLIRESIEYQMRTYPESTLKDLYKSFFQDAFGPGHLAGEGDEARSAMEAYLQNECSSSMEDENKCPLYERTGWQGNFYRVNLSVINDGTVPLPVFLDAFMDSAGSFTLPDIDDWKKEWRTILSEIRKVSPDLPDFKKDKKEIDELLAGGQYESHHSEEYNSAYHPHYRLIEKSIFETRLLPLISK